MATYKVIQDIESEDKLLGPFTLRQFIYAAIVVVTGFIAFKLAQVQFFLAIPLLPIMTFFGLLAAPFGHDQSSEVWLLAKIRFFLKPRLRIWDQSGMQELVTITAPKKIEKHLTDELSQTEVKSRLQALANTIDSRGWAIKNVNVNLFSEPSYFGQTDDDSDRLVSTASLPQEVPSFEILAEDDMLDEASNPTAQHLEAMINKSTQTHHKVLVDSVQNGNPADEQVSADYWFMNQPTLPPVLQPGQATFAHNATIMPGTDDGSGVAVHAAAGTNQADQELLEQIHHDKSQPGISYRHMKTLQPLSGKKAPPAAGATNKAEIARLAMDDDKNISTIARQINKNDKQLPDGEVTINLR